MYTTTNVDFVEILGALGGGLALFLLGIKFISEGLKAIAGTRLQMLLGTLTSDRFRGVLSGAGITAFLNSSTITTVLLVGFVSAELIPLRQAIPVIMGANIGSTLTVQLIALNVTVLTPFLLAIGGGLYIFSARKLICETGYVLLGFGLLFLGIKFMSDATQPLRSYHLFISAMQEMSNPLSGILVGAIFTAIIQSSAATLAMTITLASQGIIPLESGIALMLGANVGTCGTAILASLGKSAEARQVSIVHLLFNVVGVLFFVFIIPAFSDLIRFISPTAYDLVGNERLAAETPQQIANSHTIFSVVSAIILIWFTCYIERLVKWLIPSRKSDSVKQNETRYLDDYLTTIPSLAITRVQLELVELAFQVSKLFKASISSATNSDNMHETLNKSAEARCNAILFYISQLSESVKIDKDALQLIDLTRITTYLDSIREMALSRIRTSGAAITLTNSGDNVFYSNGMQQLAVAVEEYLFLSCQTIIHPDDDLIREKIADKYKNNIMENYVKHHELFYLNLKNKKDIMRFRQANDTIEYLKSVIRLTRVITEASVSLDNTNATEHHNIQEESK